MDELVRGFELSESLTSVVTVWSVLLGLVTSAALSSAVGWVYRRVHAESSYSQTLVHSLVAISMVTALIMAIVGSNIARAFSLVGALSIIRFRSAIKSPYDVTFIFLAIAIGMACGTRFYAVAALSTALICAVIALMHRLNFGSTPLRREFLLSAEFAPGADYENALSPMLGELFEAYSLSYAQAASDDGGREVIYSVRPREGVSDREIIDGVRSVNGDRRVSFRSIRHAVEIP